MPEKESAIDLLAAAIVKVKSQPFPAKLAGPIAGFIEYLGPEMGGFNRFIFANRWLFGSIITGVYEKTGSGNALVRTTTAPTIFNAGVKDNVIPQNAKATINFRILSGEDSNSVMERVKALINDPRIQVKKGRMQSEPQKFPRSILLDFNNYKVQLPRCIPSLGRSLLVIAGTDAKHFEPIAQDIYRFSPMIINPSNIKSFHGLNERIAVSDFKQAVRFYHRLIENSTQE